MIKKEYGGYELNRLYNEDSTDAIKKFANNSIDIILTDPPYGIGMDKGVNNGKRYTESWDNEIPSEEMFGEMMRVAKVVIIFGGNFFAHTLPRSTHWLVWDKKGHLTFKNAFSDCELIWTNLPRKSVKKYTNISQGFVSDGDERIHATQKPLRLITDILKDYAREGDTVVDFYAGSGTTAVACNDLKLNWIAFEKDKNIFDRATNRLKGIRKNGQITIFSDFGE